MFESQLQSMNDYGAIHGSSKTRRNMKSPTTQYSEEAKAYKKKYEQTKQALLKEKKNNEILTNKMQLMQEKIANQQKELQKKEDINEALLERIKSLKDALVEANEKNDSSDLAYKDKDNHKRLKNGNEECELTVKSVVGGYFGSIFK